MSRETLKSLLVEACGMMKVLDYRAKRPAVTEFLERAYAALAASPEVPREPTWEPIATAPHDPNPVLLYWPYWSEVPVIGERVNGVWWTEKWLGEDETDPGPTRWMPLTAVPRAQGGEE